MILSAQNVSKSFKQNHSFFSSSKKEVLKSVSLDIRYGECLGLVGESGSGKSTLGKMLIGIEKPDQGAVLFKGQNIYQSKSADWRREISAVFQDYTSSVNPYFQIKEIISEPLLSHRLANKQEAEEQAFQLLEKVGLKGDFLTRYPHQLSGGQLQRVCIARAISTNPSFILLDEPVSSLDVSVQVQVMDLLLKLQEEMNLTYLFITHDLTAITYLCGRACFFSEGQIIEEVNPISQLGNVKQEYSKKLLNSVMDFSADLPVCTL